MTPDARLAEIIANMDRSVAMLERSVDVTIHAASIAEIKEMWGDLVKLAAIEEVLLDVPATAERAALADKMGQLRIRLIALGIEPARA